MTSIDKMFSEKTRSFQQFFHQFPLPTLCKAIATSGLILVFFYTISLNQPFNNQLSSTDRFAHFMSRWPISSTNITSTTPTNLSHIVFGIVGSMNTWAHKKPYIEAWWRPNTTKGYLFLDRPPAQEFLPWPTSSPPFRVNENIINKFKVHPKLLTQVRIARTVLETFRQRDEGVRWYVMTDDDTVMFLDNLVEVLVKYDHTKYFYIGTNSESILSNSAFSFEMAFGGAGYALSYPLAEALAMRLDGCIERYPQVYSSDFLLHLCLADFGVALTHEKGFHQVDLHGDISGLLSAHPQSPIISLHHFDAVDPIFPSMNRSASINHLMKAVKVDHSRLLQQTICYKKESEWSFSTSWGYSVHVYEKVFPRSYLHRPLETFKPWSRQFKPPFFMFNTRWLINDPCEAPHVFFLDSIEKTSENQVITTYVRTTARNLPACSSTANHSADPISKIQVFSPATTPKEAGVTECCDVEHISSNITQIKLRACMKDENIV